MLTPAHRGLSSKHSDERGDARRPRWGRQLWGDVCIHSACALESCTGGWAQLKDIWMRWNAICLNNQESYQSHPKCAVLLAHTCAMCFNRNCYWQIFHCDSLMRSQFFLNFFFLFLKPHSSFSSVNIKRSRRVCSWGWMTCSQVRLKEGGGAWGGWWETEPLIISWTDTNQWDLRRNM